MKASLVQIGNSQGIRIPKPIIEECGFEGEVELTVEAGALMVRPVRRKRKLSELVAAFDPERHRRTAEERPWDDAPTGRETL